VAQPSELLGHIFNGEPYLPKWDEYALDITRLNDDNVDGIWHPHTDGPLGKAE
jgi:hypothetical protein